MLAPFRTTLSTHRLIGQAFDQMRPTSVDNVAVLIRLLNTIARLTARLTYPEGRSAPSPNLPHGRPMQPAVKRDRTHRML